MSDQSIITPGGDAAGKQFVHLHVHTDYSLLDGASAISWAPRIKDKEARKKKADLVKMCLENHSPACAMIDHGVMGGAIEFYIHSYNKKTCPGSANHLSKDPTCVCQGNPGRHFPVRSNGSLYSQNDLPSKWEQIYPMNVIKFPDL